MDRTSIVRRLRRVQTKEEKELWRDLKAGRFAGFKFRRQHPKGSFVLEFYCPQARLSVELDGFQHGHPRQRQHDLERTRFLASHGIKELRFWNHQWHQNREGVLLDIWNELQRRTGCRMVLRQIHNHRFQAPRPEQLTEPAQDPREYPDP